MQQASTSFPTHLFVGEHAECAAVNASKQFRRIRHWQFVLAGQIPDYHAFAVENPFVSVLIRDFCRRLFWGCGELGEHYSIVCRFNSGLYR